MAKTGSSSQFKHVVDQPASNRESDEQHKGNEQHRLSTKYIAEFGINNEKAFCPSQIRIVLQENGGKYTSVGQELGGDNPATLVESVQSICNTDE